MTIWSYRTVLFLNHNLFDADVGIWVKNGTVLSILEDWYKEQRVRVVKGRVYLSDWTGSYLLWFYRQIWSKRVLNINITNHVGGPDCTQYKWSCSPVELFTGKMFSDWTPSSSRMMTSTLFPAQRTNHWHCQGQSPALDSPYLWSALQLFSIICGTLFAPKSILWAW